MMIMGRYSLISFNLFSIISSAVFQRSDESTWNYVAQPGSWEYLLDVELEFRVNGVKLVNWPTLIRAHSGMSGSGLMN